MKEVLESNARLHPGHVETTGNAARPDFGIRLRHARQLRGMSLEQLGEQVGLTQGYLSKIENDRAVPTIASLHKIVQALDININSLLSDVGAPHSPVFVMRKEERRKLVTGHRRAGNRVVLEQLVPSGPQYLLQVNVHVIAKGGGSDEPISHRGQEFGYLLCGKLELSVDGKRIQLDEGDSFYFDSSLGHSYRNIGNSEARVVWVNTPPTF
jgi:transcriptional regulator with XRE-family HTH domain